MKKETLTYEMLMEMFAETREQLKELAEDRKASQKETDKQMKKMFAKSRDEAEKRAAEWDKKMSESRAKWDKEMSESKAKSEKEWEEIRKQMKEVRKEIGGIGESNGKMAEEMIYNLLDKDKTFANVKFDYLRKNVQIQSETYETKTELDILLVNGDTISIIETKYKVEKNDVIDVIDKKLNYFRQYNPKFNNHKIILGIGGMSFEDDAITAAKEKGIGIIKIVGDKVEYQTENIKIY